MMLKSEGEWVKTEGEWWFKPEIKHLGCLIVGVKIGWNEGERMKTEGEWRWMGVNEGDW